MRSILPFWVAFLAVSTAAQAQERSLTKPALRSIFVEVGGNGGFGSINFDRLFLLRKNYALSYRLGIAPMPLNPLRPAPVLEINLLTGNPNFRLKHLRAEFGLGTLLYFRENWRDRVYANRLNPVLFPRIGVRYQKPEGGLFFRLGFTPGIPLNRSNYLSWRNEDIFWWGGISLGKSF